MGNALDLFVHLQNALGHARETNEILEVLPGFGVRQQTQQDRQLQGKEVERHDLGRKTFRRSDTNLGSRMGVENVITLPGNG